MTLHPNTTKNDLHQQLTQWAALLLLSVGCVAILEFGHVSAVLLLGPMLAAVILAVRNSSVALSPKVFMFAQSIVGCMIATSMPISLVHEILRDWPIFVATVMSVLIASAGIGWALARLKVLPGTEAVWGFLPGAASAMALMAEGFGADARDVAFMQYTRVLLTAVVASIVARIWGVDVAAQAESGIAHAWFPHVAWTEFVQTILLAGSAAWLGWRLRIPAGPLLVAMFVGVVLQDAGWLQIELPRWLLAFGYAMVGWGIGLRFTRDIVRHVAVVLPRVLLATLGLIALCGVIALLLATFTHVDPLTAYLATSPGGADSVAIIANATKADVPFVMAMQTARFLLVILLGPALARFVAKRVLATETRVSGGCEAVTTADKIGATR
jgi:uncharacterized protein